MTVTNTTNKARFLGNGVTTIFPANIKIFEETDITVTIIDRATDTLVNTLLLNDGGPLGFTVTFDTEAETLTVTVNTAPTNDEDLQILRALPQTQETDFPRATKFPAKANEDALDKNTMILQDQQEELDRSVKLPVESTTTNAELPNPSSRRALIWDPAEDGTLINSTFDPDEQASSASASASAAAASAAAASTSETNAAASAASASASAADASASAQTIADAMIQYLFDTSTVVADPGVGNLRFNNATPSLTTIVIMDAQTNQTGNPDISATINSWNNSTNDPKGQLRIVDTSTPANFALFDVSGVTDNTGWFEISVTYVDGNGTLTDDIFVTFFIAGDAGLSGGWTQGSEVATTSGSQVTVLTGIASTARQVLVNLDSVSLDTIGGGVYPFITLGDSGGEETISYSSECYRWDRVAGFQNGEGSTSGFILAGELTSVAAELSGLVTLTYIGTNTWTYHSVIYDNQQKQHIGSGIKTLSGTLTDVFLNTPSGAQLFDNGSVQGSYRS